MKCYFIAATFLLSHGIAAQIMPDIMIGNKATEYSFLWVAPVDRKQKFELFNYTFFSVDYQKQQRNAHEIYQAVTYKLSNNLGIAAIGRLTFNEFIPQAAIALQHYNDYIFLAAYPYVQHSWQNEITSYGLFGFLQWKPKLNEKWRLFTMLMFEPNFANGEHYYSYQQYRIGLQSPTHLQFGVGGTLEQIGPSYLFHYNFGIFIRKEFLH
ncbi:MAG: hypothetical protein KF856_08705 [Cyclobacteriaceae bacterium]|nr:hypothetical protein [Cyclobacteriaceae bacterium]MBX2915333.1 hypothetical protein [Cyclobacteriaceae bacterium]